MSIKARLRCPSSARKSSQREVQIRVESEREKGF